MWACTCGYASNQKGNVQRHVRGKERYGGATAQYHQLCRPHKRKTQRATASAPAWLGAEGSDFGAGTSGADDGETDLGEGDLAEGDDLELCCILGGGGLAQAEGDASVDYVAWQVGFREWADREREPHDWRTSKRAQLDKYLIVAGSAQGLRGDKGVSSMTEWANKYGPDVVDFESIYRFKKRMSELSEPFFTTVRVHVYGRQAPYDWDCMDMIRSFAIMVDDKDLMGLDGVRICYERLECEGERVYGPFMTCGMMELLEEEHRVLHPPPPGAAPVDDDGHPVGPDGTPWLILVWKCFIDAAAVDAVMNLKVCPFVSECLWFPSVLRNGPASVFLRLVFGCMPQLCELFSPTELNAMSPGDKLRVEHDFIDASLQQFAAVKEGVLLRVQGPGRGKVFRVFFRLASLPSDMLQADRTTSHYSGAGGGARSCRECWISKVAAGQPGHKAAALKTNVERKALATVLRDRAGGNEGVVAAVSQKYSTHPAMGPHALLLDTGVVGSIRDGLTGVVIPDILHTFKVSTIMATEAWELPVFWLLFSGCTCVAVSRPPVADSTCVPLLAGVHVLLAGRPNG